MTYLYLEVRHFKIKHNPLRECPNPQFNEQCMGKFIKTRRYQKECVACMQIHHTIDKHPLMNFLMPPKQEFDIINLWD